MSDGIQMALRGKPTVALVTTQFWEQGNFVAEARGMPTLPRHQLPHPVAGTGHGSMAELAREIAPQLIATLRQESTPIAA